MAERSYEKTYNGPDSRRKPDYVRASLLQVLEPVVVLLKRRTERGLVVQNDIQFRFKSYQSFDIFSHCSVHNLEVTVTLCQ
jgi:hypothetical protein